MTHYLESLQNLIPLDLPIRSTLGLVAFYVLTYRRFKVYKNNTINTFTILFFYNWLLMLSIGGVVVCA